jgi:spore germination protein YaaH
MKDSPLDIGKGFPMQGNLIATLLALIFYVASGLFGGNSNQSLPSDPSSSDSNRTGYNQSQNIFPFSGKLTGTQANLRKEPTISSETIGAIETNSHLLILNEKNGYYLVQTEKSNQGWLPSWMVSISHYSSGNSGNKIIAGYYVENYKNDPVGYQALAQNLAVINTLIPFSFKVDQYGTITSSHNPKTMALARSAGVNTLALINNIQGNNFNSNSIHRMLSNPSSRSKAINGITRVILENGYQGANIDFENVPSKDRIYITAFFKELAAVLHSKNFLVTASLPAKTFDDLSSLHSGAFDYRNLAPYLDQIMIMTYDEHFSGGGPGPVASYPWVEQVIKYTLKYFSANKIVLGIAAYGYDWGLGSGKALNYKAIQNLISKHKITAKWHSVYKVPYFTYSSWGIKHQVWYEDRYSTASKMQLVKKYGLRGVAVWRLGYEDPGIWNTIQQQL